MDTDRQRNVPVSFGSAADEGIVPLWEAAPVATGVSPKVAVILAAGRGERMAGTHATPKPLLELDGLLLIERVILSLARAGIERFRIVVGAHADEIVAKVRGRRRLAGLTIEFVDCPDHDLGNGHSLAAGARGLDESFLLSMSDHVYEPAIAERLCDKARLDPESVYLATDARIAEVFDLDDATKVETDGDTIRSLGKGLGRYSRVDVGVFYCPRWLAAAATRAIADGAHSVSEIMRRAIDADVMRSCPIEPHFWQDVDTPEMLAEARRRLRVVGDALKPRPSGVQAWLRAFGFLFGIGIIAWLIARQPLATIGDVVSRLDWSSAAVLAFAPLWFGANTTGLWILTGRRTGWWSLFYNRIAGEGLNALLPLASVGGEPWKIWHLRRQMPAHEATTAVIADRLLNELAGLLFASVGLLVTAGALAFAASWRLALFVGCASLAALGLLFAWLLTGRASSRLAGWLLAKLSKEPPSTPRAPLGLRPTALALLCHVVGRALGALEVAFLLHVLGVPAGAAAVVAVTSLLLIAGVAGLLLPQGLGTLEAASVWALVLLGQPAAVGLAFGLLRRGRMLFYGAVGSGLALAAPRLAAALEARAAAQRFACSSPVASPRVP